MGVVSWCVLCSSRAAPDCTTPTAGRGSEPVPSRRALLRAGKTDASTGALLSQLVKFYGKYNPNKSEADLLRIAVMFDNKEDVLNARLRTQYGADLTSITTVHPGGVDILKQSGVLSATALQPRLAIGGISAQHSDPTSVTTTRTAIGEVPSASTTATRVTIATSSPAVVPAAGAVLIAITAVPDVAETTTDAALGAASGLDHLCQQMLEEHNVQPGITWGTLDESRQLTWHNINCDLRIRISPKTNTLSFDAAIEPLPIVSDESAASNSVHNSTAQAPAAQCKFLKTKYAVIPGYSWGQLPKVSQFQWQQLDCDNYIGGIALGDSAGRHAVAGVGGGGVHSSATVQSQGSADVLEKCRSMREQGGVRPGVTWGTLSLYQRRQWDKLRCNEFDPKVIAMNKLQQVWLADPQAYYKLIQEAVDGRAAAERMPQPPASEARTTIAIGVSTVTRGMKVRSFEQLALFRYLLPSMLGTVDDGFQYRMYIAYDVGDTFFDNPEVVSKAQDWLNEHVHNPLASRGISFKTIFLRFNNPLHKPGPVFNFMMKAAADDGAEYLYRINDDTEFATPWAQIAVDALQNFNPKNLGAVGPICREGNTKIMTHDMVHRQHLKIFPTYYPSILSDWWMDDWITHIYGGSRTQKGPFLVKHHTGLHSTRYEVDISHKRALLGELIQGAQRIQAWEDKNVQCDSYTGQCVVKSVL